MTTKNPNAMLRRIRSSVVALGQGGPAATPPEVHELIQAVKDLDNHLSWGGTPPEDWNGALARASTPLPGSTMVPGSTADPRSMADPRSTAVRTAVAETHERHPIEDIMRRM